MFSRRQNLPHPSDSVKKTARCSNAMHKLQPISAWHPEHILFFVHGKSPLSLWAGKAFPRVAGSARCSNSRQNLLPQFHGHSRAILFPLHSETLLPSCVDAKPASPLGHSQSSTQVPVYRTGAILYIHHITVKWFMRF